MWDKIKHIRPSLKRQITIQPREYRNKLWYVLEDRSTGQFHRLTHLSYHIVGLMDGVRTLEEVLEEANISILDEPDEHPATQEDIVELLQYLYVADLLICDFPPNTDVIFNRIQNKKLQKWRRLIFNPISWRFSLGNPSALLSRLQFLLPLITHPFTAVVWCCIVFSAVLQVGVYWPEISTTHIPQMFTPTNLVLVWLTYPFLKIVHELGHALVTRAYGGNVTDCGIVVVLGTPLPFVDASASTGFHRKRERMLVSAAGMCVELFLAACAFHLWTLVEAGITKTLLFNIMLLGSVSTLLFNGNPLLKYDGYYLLSDLIEVPNLASRANEQIKVFVKRRVFGVKNLASPANSLSGAIGYNVYAVLATLYRLFILGIIVYVVMCFSPEIAVGLACWLLAFQVGWPIVQFFRFIVAHPQLEQHRKRAISITVAGFVVLVIGFFFVPFPFSTVAQGVVWLPENAQVRTLAEGKVIDVFVENGSSVKEGDLLFKLSNPSLEAELLQKQAELKEYRARYQEVWSNDRASVNILQEDINELNENIIQLKQKIAALNVSAPSTGTLKIALPHALRGSFFKQGDIAAYIVFEQSTFIRTAVTQEELGLVRSERHSIQVKIARDLAKTFRAQVVRENPGGTFNLPSKAFVVEGGGRLTLENSSPANSLKSQKRVFIIDLELPQHSMGDVFGEHAYVRFEHTPQSLANQLYRRIRQLFIRVLL